MVSVKNRFQGATAFITAASIAFGSVGCAHLPKTGTEATGEPLNVEVSTETHTYVTQAKVGEVTHRDSSGRVVGTSEVYENRTGQYDVTKWQAFQGDEPLDDQDFFTIAGDTRSAEEIAKYRESGVTLNRVGLGLAIGGGAAAVAGIILSSTLNNSGSGVGWPTYMMSFGLVTASVGGVLAFYGVAKTKREHPIDDPAKADRAARKYNKTLGVAAPAPKASRDDDDDDDDEEEAPKPKKKKKKH